MSKANSEKVLVVDDDDLIIELINMIIAKPGREVVSFSTLKKAERYFYENQDTINLVLSDGNIEKPFDGIRWAESIYKLGMPVILVTGDPHLANKPKVSQIIGKPIDFDALIEAVDTHSRML